MVTEPDAEDLWQDDFHRPKSLRSVNPPIFVPASGLHLTHDDDDDDNEQAGNVDGDDIATWYRSLRRQTNPPNSPAPSPPTLIQPTPTLRRRHEWFISRAISQHAAASASTSASTSAPATPHPTTNSTFADLISRNPPTTAQPHRPPVFLHLGPSNKGWMMLQNQGWSEGEGLGSSAHRSSDANPMTKRLPIKKIKPGRGSSITPTLPSSPPQEVRTSEVHLDHDIVEVRKVPVIDLTLSDSEHEDVDSYEDGEEGDDDDRNNDSNDNPPTFPSDPRAEPTVLLTPLSTVLKSDRLGIGLKAKTEGPYRSSVKRVTPNAAALAAHTKASEDLRRTQHRFGKGRRAYARAEHLEREHRQKMMAYLSES
ncbi:hypothetical protein EI94DRAFT_1719246 [Lactarius quietus]|nr:hypothetical protein EI94DRAFT_1719246 [Lactarius quietus]